MANRVDLEPLSDEELKKLAVEKGIDPEAHREKLIALLADDDAVPTEDESESEEEDDESPDDD